MESFRDSFNLDRIRRIHIGVIEGSSDESEQNLAGVIRDEAMLSFLIDEVETISDIFERAACILYKIAIRHPFVQGNKRTAVVISFMLLEMAGWEIIVDGKTLYEFVISVAQDCVSQEDVCNWLQLHAKKISE